MTVKQLGGTYAPDQSQYVTLTDGNGNLVTAGAGGGTSAGYVAGRLYPQQNYSSIIVATAYTPTLDSIVATPLVIQSSISLQNLTARVVTAGATTNVKAGIWANSGTTSRPTGVALIVSNTPQPAQTSGANIVFPLVTTLSAGLYWICHSVDSITATFGSIGSGDLTLTQVTGRAALTNTATTITGLQGPITQYSNNWTTLDVTSFTWTDITGSAGIPIFYMGT